MADEIKDIFGSSSKEPTKEQYDILDGPPSSERSFLAKQFGLNASDLKTLDKAVAENATASSKGESPYNSALRQINSIDSILSPSDDNWDGLIGSLFGGKPTTKGDKAFGNIDRLLAGTVFQGTDSRVVYNSMSLLSGKAFMDGISQLKGFGSLSNAEGDKIGRASSELFATSGSSDKGDLKFNITEARADELLREMRGDIIQSMWRIQNGIKIDPVTDRVDTTTIPVNVSETPSADFIANPASFPEPKTANVPVQEPAVVESSPVVTDVPVQELAPVVDPMAPVVDPLAMAPVTDPIATEPPVASDVMIPEVAPVELFSLGKDGASAAWAAAPSGTTFTFKGEVKVKP